MEEVRATSAWVASHSSHVSIDASGLEKIVDEIQGMIPKVEWNIEGIHYFDNGPLTIQYLFVLDALNFCFWPDKDLHYDHLALGLKEALENDNTILDACRLQKYTGPELRKLLKWPRPLPLEDERVRLLHEVGLELEKCFQGEAANLVKSCAQSAQTLVSLIARHFPGLEKIVDEIQGMIPKVEWNIEGIHYFDNGPLTIQYLFVLDALNFCFWPDKDLHYDHLALGLKEALENDNTILDACRLQKYTGPELRKLLKWPRPLPLEDERVRLLHEVGLELEKCFQGEAANLVKSCAQSAQTLVSLIARHFPGLEKIVDEIQGMIPKVEWNIEGIHYFDNGPLTIQYLFVLDALNFCFWPDKDLHYDHLALGLKEALENDNTILDACRLQKYTGPELRKLLKWPRPLPLEDERVRLLHEVGLELEKCFQGEAANLVKSCAQSAQTLVSLIARHFPGFRDHSVYKGRQVFLYKRAQIFAADLWGAFKGKGFGPFHDIGSITIFADYIVPAVLRQLGILKYSSDLATAIDSNNEIGAGTEQEVEIRACTIEAVEKMRNLIENKHKKKVLSIDIDLWLWSCGVRIPLQHHRTLSIYY